MTADIQSLIRSSIETKQLVAADVELHKLIKQITDITVNAFRNGNKVLFCGNGGSAADAQHLAAEFSGRFYTDREPLYAEALHVNSSYMTAVANDYSFDVVYSRMVKACGKKGDVLYAISTSGNSKNILNAAEEAKKLGMTVIGMTGDKGGKLADLCDYCIRIPSNDTPRIQECHILIGHIICQLTEESLFKG